MQQKDNVYQSDNDGLLKECMLECLHRATDKPGAVVERNDPHPRGEPGCNSLKLVFDPVNDINCADAIACDDHTPNGFFSAFYQRTDPKGITDFDFCHLSDKDR